MNSLNSQSDAIAARLETVRALLDKQDMTQAKAILEEILAADINHPDANYIMAQLHEFDGNHEAAANCYEKLLPYKQDKDFLYKIAQVYEEADNYEKSYEFFAAAYQKDTNDVHTIERLAHVSRIVGKIDDAVELYNNLLKNEPDNIVALSQLLDLYENTNRYLYYITRARINELEGALTYAISSYKKALPLADNEEEIVQIKLKLAQYHLDENKPEQALDEYLSVLETAGDNYTVYMKLAEIYQDLDNNESAIETLERALVIYPEDKSALSSLLSLYIDENLYDKAKEMMDKIKTPDISDKINFARIYFNFEETEAAMGILNGILKEFPQNIEALSVLTDYYISVENYDAALEYAQKINKFKPNSPFSYKKFAQIYEEQGNSFLCHYNYGVYHRLKKEIQLAIDEFSVAQNINPEDKKTIMELVALYENTNESYISLEYLEKAYDLDPSDISVVKKMYQTYEKSKDYERAVIYALKLNKIKPDDMDNVFNIAECYFRIKNLEEAQKYYEIYIDKAPLSVKVEDAKEKLDIINKKTYGEESEGLLSKIFKLFSK